MNTRKGYGSVTRLAILASILLISGGVLLYRAWAAENKSWDFGTASDYTVYKGDGTEDTGNEKIIVSDGVVKLVPNTVNYNDDTKAEYDLGTPTTNVTSNGADTKVMLSKNGSVFNLAGQYTSRVFDGGTGNTWLRLTGNVVYRMNQTGMNWTHVAGPKYKESILEPDYHAPDYVPYRRGDSYLEAFSVIKDGETYKMWYGGTYAWTAKTRIFYATSGDGIDWTKYDSALGVLPGEGGWVLDIGNAGEFDRLYATAPCVIKDGETYKMWYQGYSLIDTENHWRIGYATSSDGINWTKYAGSGTGGCVLDLGATGKFDSVQVASPFVIKDGSTYKMWYVGSGNEGKDANNVISGTSYFGYATSTDGMNWTKVNGAYANGAIYSPGNVPADFTLIDRLCVIKDGDLYKMWYMTYGDADDSQLGGPAYRICYAISSDGISWSAVQGPWQGGSVQGHNGNFDPSRYEAADHGWPVVIKDGETYKMWCAGISGNWFYGYKTGDPDTTTLPTFIKFQVRSGASPALTGDFVGPDGTTGSYYIVPSYFPVPSGTGWIDRSYYIENLPYAKSVGLRSAGTFSTSHRYIQYRAYLSGSSDGKETPMLDWLAFEGSKVSKYDDTLSDFNMGTYDSNTTVTLGDDWPKPYVGLARSTDGGYELSGTYTGKVFDGGADAVWNSISWSKGGQAIEPPEPGLVALYHLDGNVNDSSGLGNNATPTSMSYDTDDPLSGSACYSNPNALGKYFTLPFNDSFKQFSALTVSCWVYFDYGASRDYGNVIFSNDDARYEYYEKTFSLTANPFDLGSWFVDRIRGEVYAYAHPVGYRQWHHVAFVWDGEKSQNPSRLYLDGKLSSTGWRREADSRFRRFRTLNKPFVAGGYYQNNQIYGFKGKMDELAIYNRGLSDDEILRQYQRGAPIKFQVRTGGTNPPTGDFLGPDGTTATFYTTAPGQSLGDMTNRYFQYRAYFESNGFGTPALDRVTVTYNTSSTFVDDTRGEFDLGNYDGSKTRWWGDEIKLAKVPRGITQPVDSGTSGLVALLHMDGDWRDASGNANDGTGYLSTRFTANAKVGTFAGKFEDRPYVDLGNLDMRESETIEFWYKRPKTDTPAYYSAYLFGDGRSDNSYTQNTIFIDGYSCPSYRQTHTDGTWLVVKLNDDGAWPNGSYFLGSKPNAWHHLAVTRDHAQKLVTMYLDGKAVAGGSYPGKTVIAGADVSTDRIGRAVETWIGLSNTYIDEFAIYNRALTAEEVAQHANAGYAAYGTNTFTSQTIDGGTASNWSRIDWTEAVSGYGEAPSATSTVTALTTDMPAVTGLWHMDGGWEDAKGSRAYTPSGDATFSLTDKKVGAGAGAFDGDADSVSVGSCGSNVQTVEFWVKSASDNCGILELKNNDVYVYITNGRVKTNNFTNPVIYVNGEPRDERAAPGYHWGQIPWLAKGWNHVAVVTNTAVSAPSVNFGEANNSYLNGKLDEVAVYNRALTSSEVKQHYLEQAGNYGLVALWHFDNTWADATGNGHDTVPQGDATFSASGKFGACASFDGAGDYLTFPDTDLPSAAQARTIEAWIKTDYQGDQSIFTYGNKDADFQWWIVAVTRNVTYHVRDPFYSTYGKWSLFTQVSTSTSEYNCAVTDLTDGKWHHVVCILHCNYGADNPTYYDRPDIKMYIDGEYVSGGYLELHYNTVLTGTGMIGMALDGSSQPFKGLIDEVALYNRPLSPPEIRDHYLRGAASLLAQVSIDGGATWRDAAGNSGQYITTTPSSLSLGSSSQTIKYKATLSTASPDISPALFGTSLQKADYPTDNPYAIPNNGQTYLGYLTSYSHTLGPDNQGTVKYQISKDGSTWYYWNSSAWATTAQGYITSNTFADINANIGTFYDVAGSGSLKFKAFLNSAGMQQAELSQVDLGYSAGRVTVTAPNGGENLLYGSYADITWTAAGTVSGTWKVEYSKNSGSTWTTIVSGASVAPVNGVYTYRWDPIPLAAVSTTARIQVTDAADSSIHDMSNANLAIGTGFEIISPNGGEKVYAGTDNNTIQWKSSGGMGTTVDLYYSLNGTDYTSIASDVVNQTGTNSYAVWSIPLGESMYTESARVKVRSEGANKEDASDAAFTIAGIAVTEPDTGDLVRIGATYTVQWKSGGAGSSVKIEYSTDGGTGWATAEDTAPNTGGDNSYDWAVDPGLSPTSNAKIKITSNSDGNLAVESGLFTLGKLQITAPNGSEVWQAKKDNATVTWTSAGFSGAVSLKYSTNGTDWTDIASGLTNDGSYTGAEGFIVPDALSDTVKFKIVSDADPSFADTSDNNFSIAGVKVTAPNGGESFNYTSNNSITWDDNNAGETATLYYSIDGGDTWAGTIASSVLQGTYSWRPSLTAGVVPTVKGMVKVVADNPQGDANPPDPYSSPMDDVSDADFTIAGLKVTAPAQGANWLIGSTQNVQWLSAGTVSDKATIYYSVLGDFSDQVVIVTDWSNNEIYPGNNTYQWAIGSTITPSTTAKVKVVAGSFTATSPTFTLKGMRVTAPALNATITQGIASNVTWSSAGVSGNVNILYSSDGGTNYNATPINATPINVTTGTYSWTPNTLVYTPSATAKLKVEVVSGADVGMSAESPQFTLKGIKVSTPAAGTTWVLGETRDITWTAAGSGSTCNIYYAADGTNFGDPINGATPVLLSAGTYSWTIPSSMTPSNGTAKVKITSDTNVSSSSGAFTMKGIRVTSPTSTTIWEVGEPVTVTHTVVGALSALNVYYVKDGIENQIGTTMPNVDFDWNVSADAVGPGIIIRLKSFMPNYTGDSGAFQIVGEATVAVTSPAANDKWKVSDSNSITWTRSGSAEKAFLVEYDDNIAFTSPEEISGTPAYDGAGHYTLSWNVPDSVGTCYIRVTDTQNAAVTDKSDAFKILPKFRVNTPNGGNTFYALKPGTTVNWGTTGTAGTVDLYYSVDSPLFEEWTKINTTAISDNGSGTTEAITSYSWTVANVQSATVKFKVQAANANLADAYDISDAVFTIKYYDVTWNVKSATTDDFLDKLFVIDTSGWASADLTAPVSHSYPYGTYSTTWSRTDYLDKSHRNWTTTSDNMTIEISMTESSLSPEYHVMSNFSYNASADKFLINSWVERGGLILSQPTSCTVHIYDAAGGPLQTLTAATADTNGVFWQEWPTTNLDQNAMYFAKVDITYSGETYSSGLSYSLNIPKAIAGLGTTVAQQLTDLQTAIGTDLATQTTAIGAKIDTLETSIGTNLDAKISTVKTDIAAVKTVVDKISEDVGAIGGDLATPISEAVAEDLAAQLAKGIQAEILTRPTSAGFGTATDIRFRTATGMSPTITVYDANNVARVASAAMVEVGTTGIYEYALTPQSTWGAGEYTVVCEEPTKNAVDSMVLSVSESVGAGAGTDEGMVNSINATVTTIDSNVKTMLSKVNTLPDDTTDVNTSVASLLATVGKTTDAAGTNSLFGKIASAQGDITAFKTDITSYVDGVETTLGTTADAAGSNTVYGKIKSLEQTVSSLGPDGAKANKELLAAKDQAAAASRAAEDIKKMIAAGGKNAEAYGALQRLAGDLAKLQSANARIGSSVTADSITDFIRETRAKLAQVAMKEGYDNLVPETGEVGQVNLTEEQDVEDLRNNMTELKALLSQVRSLLDKQVNAPVVKSWIEGK